jgi:hypothetical protein
LSGSLQNAGVDLSKVDAAITAQGEDLRLVGGFDKPYNPGGDEHLYRGRRKASAFRPELLVVFDR